MCPYPSAVNPRGTTHGDRTAEVRHVGDLGNLETDAQGNAKGSVTDNLVKLIGPESVIGVCSSQIVRSTTVFPLANFSNSAPSSSTPALTTLARVATRSPSRLATPVPALPAASLVSPSKRLNRSDSLRC